MTLNRYYSSEIIKVLSKPMPGELLKEESDISYVEAKGILKNALHRIEVGAKVRF